MLSTFLSVQNQRNLFKYLQQSINTSASNSLMHSVCKIQPD